MTFTSGKNRNEKKNKTQTQDIEGLRIEAKEHNTKEREEIFASYRKSKKALILSVRTIAEGINLKVTDMTALVDRVHSTIQIVQIAGRSVRNYAYEFETPVTVKNFDTYMDMSTLPLGCQFDDTILNCVDGETECCFELCIVNAKSGLVKR